MSQFEAGHTTNVKLTTDELKRDAYAQYCAHIASGWPKKAWCFEHPELTLTWETMEKYIREDPLIFDPIHKKTSECKSLRYWFGVLRGKAIGENKDADTASLQIIMRNKFKWDTRDMQQEDEGGESAQTHDQLMKELSRQQKAARESASNG